ncbi:replication initiator protein A [Acuticoccus sp. I52.16.1]|uniref:replication initiator protein A n=1 Tax=Acuticoccus sp. I52.16.1 TaxID=2928472 RepID=UPI001FCFA0DE|nr:replication initiator protein A [Acuticoccus sp. I52.16.1]UOM37194.1 replication initiator protein A [Acuticoccus sp. I52.16.1]
MVSFKPRKDFAALRLHDKNAYLQEVANAFQQEAGEEPVLLSKVALSRLRRFYSRRSFADLKLEEMGDGLMRDTLIRMAEAIHGKELKKVLSSEMPATREEAGAAPPPARAGTGGPAGRPASAGGMTSAAGEAIPPGRIIRLAPDDDAQLDFFVPQLHDAPLKDEMNLMDIAPFALSKVRRDGVIRYELKDSIITIEGGAEVGLATSYDYDIFLSMVSYLAEEVRRFRIEESKGRRPSLPPPTYRPSATQILRFCRRGTGGKQYLALEAALDRLQATRIKITNLSGGKRRETQSFPLIGRYTVISRTGQDHVDLVEIDVPKWVYDGVVQPDGKPTILTLNPDYFLIAQPIARFLYRLARKAAGTDTAHYTLDDLHYRSGSSLTPAKFRRKVEEIVERSQTEPLPDYDLALTSGRRGPVLHMIRRAEERTEA